MSGAYALQPVIQLLQAMAQLFGELASMLSQQLKAAVPELERHLLDLGHATCLIGSRQTFKAESQSVELVAIHCSIMEKAG